MDKIWLMLAMVSFALGAATIAAIVQGADTSEIVMTAIPAAVCFIAWRFWVWLESRR